MPIAYIDKPRCRVQLTSDRLVVVAPPATGEASQVLQEIPLGDLERLVLSEQTQISSQAVAALLRANIPIAFTDWRGQFLGGYTPAARAESAIRLLQYEMTADSSFPLTLARRIIAAKIYNQHRLLQRLNANRPLGIKAAIEKLYRFMSQADAAPDLNILRGCEGAASAQYFELWSRFLPPAYPFERRSCHPPLNPVNACISYGAALVYHEMVAALHLRGLDPGLGLLHVTENGRWSLALDLMEPFRPCLIEAFVIRLFNHRILTATDFEPRDSGVYLNPAGRRKFIHHYETRIQREFHSEQLNHRTTLRQQLLQQVLLFKRALSEPESFSPFRMN